MIVDRLDKLRNQYVAQNQPLQPNIGIEIPMRLEEIQQRLRIFRDNQNNPVEYSQMEAEAIQLLDIAKKSTNIKTSVSYSSDDELSDSEDYACFLNKKDTTDPKCDDVQFCSNIHTKQSCNNVIDTKCISSFFKKGDNNLLTLEIGRAHV